MCVVLDFLRAGENFEILYVILFASPSLKPKMSRDPKTENI